MSNKNPNLCHEIMGKQITANVVLWDAVTGDPFFLPPGRDPIHYLAKGFKTTAPVGFEMNADRPYVPADSPIPEQEWEPTRERTEFQDEYDGKLAKMASEKAQETRITDAIEKNQERLADALEVIAAGGQSKEARIAKPEKAKAAK